MSKDIGKRLAEKRKEKKYAQKDMPALLGVSERTYWTYENGSPIPSDIIVKLMNLLDTTADWLLIGKEPEKPIIITDFNQLTKEVIDITRKTVKEEFNQLKKELRE